MASEIVAAGGPRVQDLTGGDLRNGILAMAAAKLAISNDSGLMHIAAALGTPTMGIFGPTSPYHWAPLNGLAATVQTKTVVPCQPCHRPVCTMNDHRCMRDIPASDVVDIAQRVLAEAGAGCALSPSRLRRRSAVITKDRTQNLSRCRLSQNPKDPIAAHLTLSLAALERATRDAALLAAAQKIADVIVAALNAGNKLLIIGNGGSAADAQHIAAEIIGRYKQDRPAYAAIALTTDTSALTAIGNDYGFEQVFARQVAGLGRQGDVLLALTTSGRSPNILAGLRTARERGLTTIGFTGSKGTLGALCDHLLVAPSDDTAVIQQIHLAVAHGICDEVERALMRGARGK